MFTHPSITASLAEQHRRDLISQAGAACSSRATRPGRPSTPRRRTGLVQAIRRAATAAAAAAAATILVMIPAGPTATPHVSAGHYLMQSSYHFF